MFSLRFAQPRTNAPAATQSAMLPRMLRLVRWASLFLLLICFLLQARVVRVEITSCQDVLDGKAFGDVGAYERITGSVHFSVAVTNLHNARIVDLNYAVNLRNGEVEFSVNFIALWLKDP